MPKTYTFVEINNITYGQFDDIAGLNHLKSSNKEFSKITFKRDFVTEPSLYLWAKNSVGKRLGQQQVHLVERLESGKEVGRTILKSCHPVSWSLEATNSSVGGFHERVELAVTSLER